MTITEQIKQKINDIDFFSPYIVVVVIAIYVALAAMGYYYHIRNLQWADGITYLYIIFGTAIFIFGILFPKLIIRIKQFYKSNQEKRIKEAKNPSWYKIFEILLSEKILLGIVGIAILLQVINLFSLGGIPLLSGYLKFKATTDLWRIAYIIFLPAINLLLAKYPRKWYYMLFIIGLAVFAINGYRTTTIAIILSVLITTYYTMRLKTKYLLIFIIITAIIGIILGYVAVKSIQWQTWVLNPLELVYYRAGFTMMVLDKIAHMPGLTGGELFYQALTGGHPRVTVGQVVLGYQIGNGPTTSITSTIFGPAVLDYGAWGLTIQMFILGLILSLMHGVQRIVGGAYTAIYAIMLAHTMIWVETGPTDSMVWFFYVLGIIALLIYFKIYYKPVINSNQEYKQKNKKKSI
ncbi:MAG: oligosaccharide repeat unit polymerase family protein [Methanobacterium sp.]|nr:oligosaccharide repeat unit polymerase family protein [Methanobacterium sp.]